MLPSGAAKGDRMKNQSQVLEIIIIIKHDLPTLFHQDISYDIYSPDIYFRDPVNKFKGKINYRIIFWTLRFHAQLFFTQIYFDLHEVYQADVDTILAKWTVRGILRVPWKARILLTFVQTRCSSRLYSVNLIYEHIDTWDRKPSEILSQFIPKGESGKPNYFHLIS